jgi:hypothetical protein
MSPGSVNVAVCYSLCTHLQHFPQRNSAVAAF